MPLAPRRNHLIFGSHYHCRRIAFARYSGAARVVTARAAPSPTVPSARAGLDTDTAAAPYLQPHECSTGDAESPWPSPPQLGTDSKLEHGDYLATGGYSVLPHSAEVAGPEGSVPASASGDKSESSTRGWSPRDMSSGQALVLGGSVATAVLLTVFRKEIAPGLKWLVTQINSLTDKSLISQGGVEALATLAAVLLTLYWSFAEYRASSERLKELEGLEAQVEGRLEGALARLAAAEARLAAAEGEVAALRRALEEREGGGGSGGGGRGGGRQW